MFLLEIELHRLFRTDSYNTAERRNSELMKNIQESERIELHGPKMRARRKLLRNSSLPYQLLNSDCDYRLLALGNYYFHKTLLINRYLIIKF